MQLREYQTRALDEAITFIHKDRGNGIVSLPCGSGKSIIAAKLAEHIHSCKQRPIIVANRAKLLDQNSDKLSIPHGIVSAGLKRFEYESPIVIGGIQTIYNKSQKLGKADWLIIDECQGVPNNSNSDSMYSQFISQYPSARIIGLSATPWRTQEGQLSWAKIIHETSYQELWDSGYLSPLTNKLCDNPDLSGIGLVAGEYNLGQLAAVMNVDSLVLNTAQKIAAYTQDRKKVLIFCVNVEHAINTAACLHNMGLQSNFVHGKQSEERRTQIYNDFENGDLKYLCNVELATIGVDFPCIDCIVILRPTKSSMLHEQMLGRGVRLFPSKTNCLILDFAGNLAEHGNLGNPIWKWLGSKKIENKKNHTKICPQCEANVSVFRSQCPECNYIFLKETIPVEHNEDPDIETDLTKQKTLERFYNVGMILYLRHKSKAGNESLCVTYQCGKIPVSEYIPFGSNMIWAQKKCLEWIKPRAMALPESIEEALMLCETWRKPQIIKVRPQKNNPKYLEVVGVEQWKEKA